MLYYLNYPLQSVVYATDGFPEGDAFRLILPTFPLSRESPRVVEPSVGSIRHPSGGAFCMISFLSIIDSSISAKPFGFRI